MLTAPNRGATRLTIDIYEAMRRRENKSVREDRTATERLRPKRKREDDGSWTKAVRTNGLCSVCVTCGSHSVSTNAT